MKQLALGLLLAFAWIGCSEGKLKPGTPVAAKWQDMWFLAEIKGKKGDQYQVHYGDGTDGEVRESDIKLIPDKPDLKKGDPVWAAWQGARLYEGTVETALPDGFLIQWKDGSTPSKVANGKLVKQ